MIPVSLVYLAAMLKREGIKVAIIDGQVESYTEQELSKRLQAMNPRIVGITCMTPIYYEAVKTAQVVKETLPEAITVVGGVHATLLPEGVMENECFDLLMRNEAEYTFTRLCKAILGGGDFLSIEGLTHRQDGRLVHNPDAPFITDLDAIPFPARELVNMDLYHQIPDAVFQRPVRCILTSRGCPFRCIFCSARQMSGFKYRYRSAKNVLEEWDLLAERYGARQVLILDDNFLVNRQRTIDICNGLIERGYHKRIVWTAAGRADQVDQELCNLMKEAGCVLLSFGVESGSERLLELINKGLKKERIIRAVKMAKKAGLLVRGTLILGLPTETYQESIETIEFAKSLGLDVAKFSLATPYPGTELYNIAKKEGQLRDDDWSRFSSMAGFSDYDPSYVPMGRDPAEMKRLQKLATRQFYLRPKQIMRLLANTRSTKDLKLYFEAARSLFK